MIIEIWIFMVVVLLLTLRIFNGSSNTKAPPGPMKFPIVGNIFQLSFNKAPHLAMHDLSMKYGPVMSLKVGFSNMVLLSSYDAMKDILGRKEATGRDVVGIVKERCDGKNLGIITSVGEPWRKLRSYTISTFRDYGYGKRNSMETLITEEIQNCSNYLKKQINNNEGVFDLQKLLQLSVLNVLWTIIGGCVLEYEDKKLHYLLDITEKIKKGSYLVVGLISSFPFLRFIPPISTDNNFHKEINADMRNFFKDLLVKYKDKYRKTKEVNCYFDSFVQKIEETANDPNSLYTDEQFVMCAMDLFQAGTETTSTHIGFAILLLIVYPEIQTKIQQEIEDTVGNDRLPQLEDRDKLFYTQATILEVFRWARTTVNLVPRKSTEKFDYNKWTIEKDTVIIANLHSINFDETFWRDPHVFRPDRFLNKNGCIIGKKAERIIPFGLGKRICPGEPVARDSIFLYLTTLLQTFTFENSPGDKLPSPEPVPGLVYSHVPFRAKITLRKCK